MGAGEFGDWGIGDLVIEERRSLAIAVRCGEALTLAVGTSIGVGAIGRSHRRFTSSSERLGPERTSRLEDGESKPSRAGMNSCVRTRTEAERSLRRARQKAMGLGIDPRSDCRTRNADHEGISIRKAFGINLLSIFWNVLLEVGGGAWRAVLGCEFW